MKNTKMNSLKEKQYIINSQGFIFLTQKTQVLSPSEEFQFVGTNRFSHSYHVAASAKIVTESIFIKQKIDLDYQNSIENACLLHDIGHSAFGHQGAEILNDYFNEITGEGFEDNNNNFMIMKKYKLLSKMNNYLIASLIKYPKEIKLIEDKKVVKKLQKNLKEALKEDKEEFKKYNVNYSYEKTMANQVMDEADRNSYITHDLSDLYTIGWGESTSLKALLKYKKYKKIISKLMKSIDNKEKTKIRNIFNELNILFNSNYKVNKTTGKLEYIDEKLFDLREEMYLIELKEYIYSTIVTTQRMNLKDDFILYIKYVIDNEYYPSKYYSKRIKKSKTKKEKLKNIKYMIAEQTDDYVKNYIIKIKNNSIKK
jgi:dGTPase